MALLPRARLGLKGSDNGIWVSPPGVNALTAAPSQLNLEITRKTAQLIGYGRIYGSTTVALGLSRVPVLFISNRIDYLYGGSYIDVLVRPSNFNSADLNVYATVNGGGASVSFSQAIAQDTAYGVYRLGI